VEILQKLIAKVGFFVDKRYFSCCGKRAEEVSSGSWSKRNRPDLFWWQARGSSDSTAKSICIFQTVSSCLWVA